MNNDISDFMFFEPDEPFDHHEIAEAVGAEPGAAREAIFDALSLVETAATFFRGMFPIEAPELKDRILHEILPAYLRDNVKARILRADGGYDRVAPPVEAENRFRAQERLLALRPAPQIADAIPANGAAHFNGVPRSKQSLRCAEKP